MSYTLPVIKLSIHTDRPTYLFIYLHYLSGKTTGSLLATHKNSKY